MTTSSESEKSRISMIRLHFETLSGAYDHTVNPISTDLYENLVKVIDLPKLFNELTKHVTLYEAHSLNPSVSTRNCDDVYD